jgi:3-methyladenine DNA glycosylase Tag
MSLINFKDLQRRAEKRKGGWAILQQLLPAPISDSECRKLGSHVFLSQMTRGVFNAGFVWRVIEAKWPDFEDVFLSFNCEKLLNLPDEFWDGCADNKRIVRNIPKILTIRENAAFILNTEQAEGKSFADFIFDWPREDLIGLWAHLKKHGSRLGGMTGQYLLRRLGKESFILSKDVVVALRELGLDIKDIPSSKRELTKIQETLSEIHKDTGLSYTHISKILGFSVGVNYPVEFIETEVKRFEANIA